MKAARERLQVRQGGARRNYQQTNVKSLSCLSFSYLRPLENILNSATLNTFYLPPRPLGGGAEPSQANSESGSGQQQAHSSFTAASHKHVVGQQPL
jgi:hypothetical protein